MNPDLDNTDNPCSAPTTTGSPGFRITTGWTRPHAATVDAFTGVSSSQTADAMHRMGGIDPDIHRMWPAPPFIGTALPVATRSADNLLIHHAIRVAQPGDVLVVNTQDNRHNAGFGELLGRAALAVGIVGVVIDGVVRDIDQLADLGLPIYARGTSPTACDKQGPGELGRPIACGGVVVAPGDLFVADHDGVTVVPTLDIAHVAQRARQIVDRERQRVIDIDAGHLVRPEIASTLHAAGLNVEPRTPA